jgi:hypothetical protein
MKGKKSSPGPFFGHPAQLLCHRHWVHTSIFAVSRSDFKRWCPKKATNESPGLVGGNGGRGQHTFVPHGALFIPTMVVLCN